jgi:hypothetical protein
MAYQRKAYGASLPIFTFSRREPLHKAEELPLRDLANYMHNAFVQAISDRYPIVSYPGPGVARVRVAITDISKGSPALNVLPQTKLSGVGLGGAAMEAEVIDSQTGEQLAAVLYKKRGNQLSFAGVKKWGDAKAVMDAWAKTFRKRIDEAHGG